MNRMDSSVVERSLSTNRKNNVNEIKESYLCYGCGVCNVVCAAQAITMQYDNIGRLQPEIYEDKCINCGICKKLCPSLDMIGIQFPTSDDPYIGEVKNVYVGKANDEQIYRNSQSGGMVTAVLKHLFEEGFIDGAIVCRVDYAKEYLPKAVVVTTIEELYACQKSSYVPIDMVSALKDIEDLHSIAFVGTGCHIQGIHALRAYKTKYHDKIKYTLGLICDRTLCKTITEVISKDKFNGEKKKIVWRDKTKGYKNARLLIKMKNGKEVEEPQWKRHALKDSFTNPRCRICFDKLNVHSDITFGDPWGMNNVDWENGTSVVLTRTELGQSVIQTMINNQIVSLNNAPLNEVMEGQLIMLRKKMVSDAISIYKENNWLSPSYINKLQTSDLYGYQNELSCKISLFISDSKKDSNTIIRKKIAYLRKVYLKTQIMKFLYPLRLIKHISLRLYKKFA